MIEKFVRRTLQGYSYAKSNVMLAGLAAVTTIVVVWSMATFAKPKLAGKVENASATFWTLELMERHGRNLPAEYWDPF
jgi:hypothetical protein